MLYVINALVLALAVTLAVNDLQKSKGRRKNERAR